MLYYNKKHCRRIVQLIEDECANYQNGNCLGCAGCKCKLKGFSETPGFKKGILCSYFEKNVLPNNKELQAEIIEFNTGEALLFTRVCESCGKSFKSHKKNILYCKSCVEIKRKERYKTYNKKRNNNAG